MAKKIPLLQIFVIAGILVGAARASDEVATATPTTARQGLLAATDTAENESKAQSIVARSSNQGRMHLRRPTCHFHFSLATKRRTIDSELPDTGHPNQPAVLPFPPEPASFKIKRNLPELRPPKPQNAVKIVPVILPVICDKGNLRADFLLA